MNPVESWYRELLKRLRKQYGQAVGEDVFLHRQRSNIWDEFADSLQEVFQWADISKAAKLRWKGLHERIYVPEFGRKDFEPGQPLNMGLLLENNAWARSHAETTFPLIEHKARIAADIEAQFVRERAKAIKQDPQALPLYRLEMIYRNTMSEVITLSEQVELSDPDVGDAFPYCEYVTSDDGRVRPTHARMAGFVAMRVGEGLTILRRVAPPNGYNCRCELIHRAWFEAVRNGWATTIGKSKWEFRWPNSMAKQNYERGLFPDQGWDHEKFVAAT